MGPLETPKPLRWWLLCLCRKISLMIGRSNGVSHPISVLSFVQFISSCFLNWAGWKPGNPETGACLSFTKLMKVFFSACSSFSPHSNFLPLFCLTGTRCFAHSSVLKYWACAYFCFEWKEKSLPQLSPCHKQHGRKDIWVSIHLDATGFYMGSRKDCSNQATWMKIHHYKQDPKAEDQWNLLKIPPNSRSHPGLTWLRKSNI